MPDSGYPYGEFDASKWADEFFRVFGKPKKRRLDKGTMLGWFAAAIMTGYDIAKAQQEETPFVDEVVNAMEVRRETILEEAQRIVSGPRQEAYGSPFEDHSRVGRMWAAILGIDDIPPHLVSMMMVAVKVSREVHEHDRDNLVDIAGYSFCADLEVAEERT